MSVSTHQILVPRNDSEIFLLTSHLYIHRRESCQEAGEDWRRDTSGGEGDGRRGTVSVPA